jgi:deoxyribonuclease V
VPGSHAPLRRDGEVVASALRTRAGVKPVFNSVGHALTLAQARTVVLRCCRGYRLPEPLRRAHLLANEIRREAGG